MNEVLTPPTPRRNLDTAMQKEKRPDPKGPRVHDSVPIKYPEQVNPWRQQTDQRLPGVRREGARGVRHITAGLLSGRCKCSGTREKGRPDNTVDMLNPLNYRL